jgi:hypothetical protein
MWQVVKRVIGKLIVDNGRRKIDHALALHLRGEARPDGLKLISVCNMLQIQWRARDIHPWDRDSPRWERDQAFVAQSLADTEAAIARLLESMPQVDVLEVSVLAPESERMIMSGTVCRSSLTEVSARLSIGMRLRNLGIIYHSAGSQFEWLDAHRTAYDSSTSIPLPQLGHVYRNRQN